MKFENTRVMNFEGAFRGLRNPLESWEKSDSEFGIEEANYLDMDYEVGWRWAEKIDHLNYEEDCDAFEEKREEYSNWLCENGILKYDNRQDLMEYAFLGPNDIDLAHRMIKAGSADRKFLRQIFVSVDITAPLYWWKELDTYKIGTVANSTSTMHKLATTPITKECFELEDFSPTLVFENEIENTEEGVFGFYMQDFRDELINRLEYLRIKYLETKDKRYWKELIRWLPESWLQTRTWTCNYETLRNIYFQRKHHKLTEWHWFCNWIETLPYSADLITYTGKEEN